MTVHRRADARARANSPGTGGDDAGFTMVELLAALTLLALIVATVPGLVRLASRTLRVAGDLTRSQSDVPALDAIADKLSQARGLMKTGDDNTRRVQFWGTPTSVRFIAPGVVGASGGLVTYELALAQNAAGAPMLALSRVLLKSGDSDDSDRDAAGDIRVPMPETRRIALRYFGPRGGDPAADWGDTWDEPASLPQLVEIRTLTARSPSMQLRTVTAALRFYVPPPRSR